MNEIEIQVLENLFDALDRLFDHESKVVDLYALIYATFNTNFNSVASLNLKKYAVELDVINRSNMDEKEQREKALKTTNDLRIALNDLLPS